MLNENKNRRKDHELVRLENLVVADLTPKKDIGKNYLLHGKKRFRMIDSSDLRGENYHITIVILT